jgi:hypothetical protein
MQPFFLSFLQDVNVTANATIERMIAFFIFAFNLIV